MSETPPSTLPAPPVAGYEAGSLIVQPRPNEFPFPMRESEFQILCDGETSDARAARERYIGAGVSSFIGLIGVFATTDWGTVWQPNRRWQFVISSMVLFGCAMGSVVGICIHQSRINRTLNNSPYSRLTRHIQKWFESRPKTDSGDHTD